MSNYKGRPLGSIGHMGTFSFHETKNFTSGGEGGLLIINDDNFTHRAEIIREKGTNRSQFFRGMVDKYSWVDVGSSYLPSEIQAAYLWGQLEMAQEITQFRLNLWNNYQQAFSTLAEKNLLELPKIPRTCEHNGHMYYIKTKDMEQRSAFIEHLKRDGIYAVFHYVPLHSAQAGARYSRFHGNDEFTTVESERLVRLPIFYGMSEAENHHIIQSVNNFFA